MKKLDQLISFFNDHGYQAYGVGGCVRNYLLGLEIHDFDVATDATPLEMLSLFKDFKTSTVGQKYGTIGVYFEGLFFECTTYRSDSLESDFRRPEIVTYESSLYKDLQRRDFTMNGLAYKQGELIDVVNGQSDIKHRLIRAVGNPRVRFVEDALRMLRALRFVSELGFEIEQETLLAMQQQFHLLNHISKERISSEVKRLVMGPNVNDVIDKYYAFLEIILGSPILPITHQTHYIARLLTMAPNIQLDTLVFSKREIKQINSILKHRNEQIDHRQLLKLTHDWGIKVVDVLADYLGIQIDYSKVLTISDLKIDGHDLIKMRVPKEKRASLLKAILYEVIDGTIENNLESIIEFINQLNDLF